VVPFIVEAVRLAPPAISQHQIDVYFQTIDRTYRNNGSFHGRLGFPIAPHKYNQQTGIASRLYAGGSIKLQNEIISIVDLQYVRVKFLGFRCIDGSSPIGSEEPYFFIGAIGPNGYGVKRFGPYDDVDFGEDRFESADIITVAQKIAPPVELGIIAYEHDSGNVDEAEQKVIEGMRRIVNRIADAPADFTQIDASSHVMPGWFRDIGSGWAIEGFAAILGMGDDKIGTTSTSLFDDTPQLVARSQYPIKGSFGSNDYTHNLFVGDFDDGMYEVFFRVQLWPDPTPIIIGSTV
jgi:hypothetical protein